MTTLGYDIFRRLPDGSPLWVGEVSTLDQARKKVELLKVSIPGQYFVREASTGNIVCSADSSDAQL